MFDAELRGAEPFPANEAAVIIAEGIHAGARLPQPEGGLYYRGHPGVCHGLVIVRGTGSHMNMRIKKTHAFDGIQVSRIMRLGYEIVFRQLSATTHINYKLQFGLN